jgi:hypothetical protein
LQAGLALGEAIDGLRGVIADEHESAKRGAQAQLPPGEMLPDDGGDALPPGPDGGALGGEAVPSAPQVTDGGDAPPAGVGGPMADDGYTVTQVSYREPEAQAPKPAAKQPTIPGKVVAGSPLSDADVEAIDGAAKSVPKQFQRYVAYSGVIKVGGSLSWRANNPGNLRDAASKIDTISGAVGTFAVFATMDDGRAAQRALYLDKYGTMTVKAAIEKLTPPSENDTTRYLERLKAAGVDLDKDVKSQIDKLMPAVEANEGMITGVEVPRSVGSPSNKLVAA